MHTETNEALIARLRGYDTLVEVGIGERHGVAAGLADLGVAVTATDVYERAVPAGVEFVRDDVTDPDPEVYADADAIYALNLPPELHRPTLDVAATAGADFLFTTLGGDPATITVERETLPGETLFHARSANGKTHGPPE